MTTRAVRLIAVLLAVTACNRPASGGAAVDIDAPNSWIDRPLEGTRLLAGGTLPIVWHASGDDGIRRVEILIDGEPFEEVDDLDPDLTLAQGETEWTAAGAGEHLIQVVATGPDEVVGPPAARKVIVFAEGGSLIVAAYSDLNEDGDAEDAGEGPLEGVQLVVGQCWSESFATTGPDGLAGYSGLPMEECLLNFLYPGWVFSGTIPAGLDLPIHFTPDPAEDIVFTLLFTQPPTPKPNPTATLAFATTIPVFPVVTAIPPVDDVPPPKPQIISPDGEVVACLEDVVLRWGEVSDPSGIEYYEIVLRVNTGGADFTTVATWQVESFTALDVSDQTDCGSTYGWLVRARDNAGNWSANDGAFFGIDLP